MTTLARAVAVGESEVIVNAPTGWTFPRFVKIDSELLPVGGQQYREGTTLVLSSPATAAHDSGATVSDAGRPFDPAFLSSVVPTAAGNAFPTSPAAGTVFDRTDLGILYRYTGAAWHSAHLYRDTFSTGSAGAPPLSSTFVIGRFAPPSPTQTLWLEELQIVTQVGSPNSDADIWTVNLRKKTPGDSETVIATFPTTGDTPDQWAHHVAAIGAVYDPATHPEIDLQAVKGGSAGNFFWAAHLTYRLIG